MRIMLDANVLSGVCLPRQDPDLAGWFSTVLKLHGKRLKVFLPEIVDYEVRRGLRHIALRSGTQTTRGLKRLDQLKAMLTYLPIDTPTMLLAADLWAEARFQGIPTTDEKSLDGDVILAAQARQADAAVVTQNVRHLSRFVKAYRWQDLSLPYLVEALEDE